MATMPQTQLVGAQSCRTTRVAINLVRNFGNVPEFFTSPINMYIFHLGEKWATSMRIMLGPFRSIPSIAVTSNLTNYLPVYESFSFISDSLFTAPCSSRSAQQSSSDVHMYPSTHAQIVPVVVVAFLTTSTPIVCRPKATRAFNDARPPKPSPTTANHLTPSMFHLTLNTANRRLRIRVRITNVSCANGRNSSHHQR